MESDLYSMQLFGESSSTFADKIESICDKEIEDAVEQFVENIRSQPVLMKNRTDEELMQGKEKALTMFRTELERRSNRLEHQLRSQGIFDIPHNVLLPEDQAHGTEEKIEDDQIKLEKELSDKLRKLKASYYADALMQKELLELEKLQKEADSRLSSMKDMLQQTELIIKEKNRLNLLLAPNSIVNDKLSWKRDIDEDGSTNAGS